MITQCFIISTLSIIEIKAQSVGHLNDSRPLLKYLSTCPRKLSHRPRAKCQILQMNGKRRPENMGLSAHPTQSQYFYFAINKQVRTS